jgi:hypothetical protein
MTVPSDGLPVIPMVARLATLKININYSLAREGFMKGRQRTHGCTCVWRQCCSVHTQREREVQNNVLLEFCSSGLRVEWEARMHSGSIFALDYLRV